MVPTDFARSLTQFLSDSLSGQKNVSPNPIRSYRDSFKRILRYLHEREGISPEKITMAHLTSASVTAFLGWLETERRRGIATRNLRRTALPSFFRYAQAEFPESLLHFQEVMAIPVKKGPQRLVEHLTPEGIRVLLEPPDRSGPRGRRDLVMLSTLYDSGARVQELIELRVGDFLPGAEATLVLTGKGNKTRPVPLMTNTASLLVAYISEHHLDAPHKKAFPLFANRQHNRLTKDGGGLRVREVRRSGPPNL